MLERMWRKGNPPTPLVGMKVGAATVENSMEVPQKAKKEGYHMIQLSDSWAYIWKNHNLKRFLHTYVQSSTIHNSQDKERM